jgi:hypothetical protein
MRHKNSHASVNANGKLCPTGKRPQNAVRSLGEIVERYILEYRGKHEEELKFYREQQSLRKAVGLAARSIGMGGRKHPHQWRLTAETLNSAASELESVLRAIRKCGNFGALIGLVEQSLENVRGIGDLTTYDIAHRVGAYLCLEPELVYLHRGTRNGAKLLGIDERTRVIEPSVLPSVFRRLKPYEMEDALCIYKEDLKQLARQDLERHHRRRGHC